MVVCFAVRLLHLSLLFLQISYKYYVSDVFEADVLARFKDKCCWMKRARTISISGQQLQGINHHVSVFSFWILDRGNHLHTILIHGT